jgi:glycosyltransferase involved in cell wall biosynthesis
MRILVASDHYPPMIGGGQLTTWFLATELAQRGHDVAVATVWQPSTPAVEAGEVPVYRLRQLRTWIPRTVRRGQTYHQPPFVDPITAIALRRVINDFAPDVVHSHGWFSYSCAAALLGKDIPLVLSARDYGYICANRTLLQGRNICSGPAMIKCLRCAGANYGRPKGWIAALGVWANIVLLRRKTAGIHYVSRYVKERVEPGLVRKRRGPKRPIIQRVIHETVSTEREFADDRHYVDRLPEEPFILFVGALRIAKGVEELLAAYALLESPPPLVLIGTREHDTPTALPAGALVLNDYPHTAIMAAWRRCLFGVIPSRLPEPFGLVLLEAMRSRKAVITTVPGGHGDVVVDGVTGLLVPPGDPIALADAMQGLLRDNTLRERLADAAYRRAALITPETSISAFEHLYRDVVLSSDREFDIDET